MLNPNTNTILIHIHVLYLSTCAAYNGDYHLARCVPKKAVTLEKEMKHTVYTALILCNVNLSNTAHGSENACPDEKPNAYQMDLS